MNRNVLFVLHDGEGQRSIMPFRFCIHHVIFNEVLKYCYQISSYSQEMDTLEYTQGFGDSVPNITKKTHKKNENRVNQM